VFDSALPPFPLPLLLVGKLVLLSAIECEMLPRSCGRVEIGSLLRGSSGSPLLPPVLVKWGSFLDLFFSKSPPPPPMLFFSVLDRVLLGLEIWRIPELFSFFVSEVLLLGEASSRLSPVRRLWSTCP